MEGLVAAHVNSTGHTLSMCAMPACFADSYASSVDTDSALLRYVCDDIRVPCMCNITTLADKWVG